MDQFAQMKFMLSSFLKPRQETTRTAFSNYLASEVEALEKNFHTFRNEAVKLLSEIQSRSKERTHQPKRPTLSRSSSATSKYVSQTFQQPQQLASAVREYVLHIPETQMLASQAILAAQQTQLALSRQATTRHLKVATFHHQPKQAPYNPASAAFVKGNKSAQHDLRTFLGVYSQS